MIQSEERVRGGATTTITKTHPDLLTVPNSSWHTQIYITFPSSAERPAARETSIFGLTVHPAWWVRHPEQARDAVVEAMRRVCRFDGFEERE
jgi:hypothetical protein